MLLGLVKAATSSADAPSTMYPAEKTSMLLVPSSTLNAGDISIVAAISGRGGRSLRRSPLGVFTKPSVSDAGKSYQYWESSFQQACPGRHRRLGRNTFPTFNRARKSWLFCSPVTASMMSAPALWGRSCERAAEKANPANARRSLPMSDTSSSELLAFQCAACREQVLARKSLEWCTGKAADVMKAVLAPARSRSATARRAAENKTHCRMLLKRG
mmetsp:Transcript_44626/g.105727  ORF Transcript_44626/g.105727 Transcript_44626/m.105727 type:complete len:215 (+) Transcript_44626:1582-2226(+)